MSGPWAVAEDPAVARPCTEGPLVLGPTAAVAIIGAVRGLPDKEEREAAQGGALPILGSPSPKAPQS